MQILYRNVFPWPGKHPALTLAAVKPYLQGAAAKEGFGSSSLLRTRWRSFSGSKKASKKIKNMPPSHEIEVKFRITDLSALTARLMSEGFRLITPRTHEMNTLYDLADSGLRNRGALLRLRQYGDRWTVTYKDQPTVQGRHKMRREIETLVENGPALAQILEALGYQPRFSYEKFRTEWADGSGHMVIDETPVGNFGEIEGAPEWIDEAAGRLNIAHDQYITLSYSELFAEWKQRTGSHAANMLFNS
jgi:adenylate cyclase, class 2